MVQNQTRSAVRFPTRFACGNDGITNARRKLQIETKVNVKTDIKSNIRQALLDDKLRAAVRKATDHSVAQRDEVVAELPNWEEMRAEAAQLRDRALSELDKHLVTLEERAFAKGIQVHWAKDAEEANRIIAEICRDSVQTSGSGATPTTDTDVGATRASPSDETSSRPIITKSKSMTTEEIELTPYLEKQGFEVVETDLGEYIVQIAGQMPSHITAPALHLSRADIGKLFAEKLGADFVEDPVELISIARKALREKFLKADIGITGANFAIAETGTPMMVENEGNGRLVGAIPKVQIHVMGIEKVVPTWDDFLRYLELLPRSATGQRITGSVLFFNRPRNEDDRDGPEQQHLVILDNGRSKALEDPKLRSILRCIRCGACLNVCPVYRRTGGHAYGWVYPGPIGAVLAPIFLGLEEAADHPFASSLCGRCHETCPVKIPLHHQLLTLRHRVVQQRTGFSSERAAMNVWQGVMDRPELYSTLSEIPRFLLHDVLRGHWKPKLPVWGKEHDGPEIAPVGFPQMFSRESSGSEDDE